MPEPPGGTVTFLFSDIEGSTRRWEEHPQAMKVALPVHDSILREAIERNGGYIFQTIGDAFCAAFPTAPEALAAAVQAQRALHEQEWGEIETLRVRMALHTGVAELDDRRLAMDDGQSTPLEQSAGSWASPNSGRFLGFAQFRQSAINLYSGAAFDRTARLLPIGYGGQTLLTMATEQLVRDSLPAGTTLHDMGERRFRDLRHSEHVFSLLIEGLPSDFPPLKTLEGTPNNLPIRSTSMVGREDELEACRAFLRRPNIRLLTLLGPGGIGKTRLSLHLGASMLDDFTDGVYAIALAHITDPAGVAQAIAQALNVRQTSSQPIVEGLKDYLRTKHILLVLDNFEQVLSAAPMLWDLLSVSPSLKIVVTSRGALDLTAEHIYEVPSLSLPEPDEAAFSNPESAIKYEAVSLFTERARAVKSDFALTAENVQSVAGICAQLDGLPLAIELAAARIKILSPQMMLARLDSRLKLLTGGGRDLPARQQTLRATIEWSFDLLANEEKKLFRWLSVFVKGAPFEAIEAIATDEGDVAEAGGAQTEAHLESDVLDTLSSLVSKSLLRQLPQPDGGVRFGMLSTIREFASERLAESGERTTLLSRYARFFLAFVEEAEPHLRDSQQLAWLRRLDVEHDNLQSVLAWAVQERHTEIGLRLGSALWRFWYIKSYLSEGRHWLMQLLDLPYDPAIAPIRGRALNGAGSLIYNQGDYDLAQSLHEKCLEIARSIDDKRSMAGALNNLALIAKARNHYDQAYALFEEALEINREAGNRSWEGINYDNMGNVRYDQGDYVGARDLVERSVAIFTALGDSWGMAMALADLGRVTYELGDYAAARDLYGRSLALQHDLGDKRNSADTLNKLGVVVLNQGDYAEAHDLFEQSLSLFQDLGDKRGIATSRHNLGVVSYREGNYHVARAYLEESLKSRLQLGDKRDIAETHNNLGLVAFAQGDYSRAETELTNCLEQWRELGNKALIPLVLNNLGLVAICLGEFDRGIALLDESLEASRISGKKLAVALAILNLGLARGGQGDYEEAERLYKESLGIFSALGDKLHIATCLVRLATLTALTAQPERALMLAGAADAIFEHLGVLIPPFERLYYEPAIAAARALLGEQRAATAWEQGRATPLEDVLAGLVDVAARG